MVGWQPRALELPGGPRPLAVAAWQRGRSAMERHPVATKLAQTAAGFAFGDVLAQTNCFSRRPHRYQVWRTASMGAAGVLFAGPLQAAGLQWMDAHVMPARRNSVAAGSVKFVLDNILGCALWQAALLAIDRSYRASAARLLDRREPALKQLSL